MSDSHSMVPTTLDQQAQLKAILEAQSGKGVVRAFGQDWILFIDEYKNDFLQIGLVQFWSGMQEIAVTVPAELLNELDELLFKNMSFSALRYQFEQLGWLESSEG